MQMEADIARPRCLYMGTHLNQAIQEQKKRFLSRNSKVAWESGRTSPSCGRAQAAGSRRHLPAPASLRGKGPARAALRPARPVAELLLHLSLTPAPAGWAAGEPGALGATSTYQWGRLWRLRAPGMRGGLRAAEDAFLDLSAPQTSKD